MALFEDMFKGNLGTGLAVGGAMMLAPTVLPVVGRILRPIAKSVIKTGLVVYNEAASGIGEASGDLVAEARAELEHEGRTTGDIDTARRRGGPPGKTEQPA